MPLSPLQNLFPLLSIVLLWNYTGNVYHWGGFFWQDARIMIPFDSSANDGGRQICARVMEIVVTRSCFDVATSCAGLCEAKRFT